MERLANVLDRIRDAEKRAGRAPGSVTLIAVTKTKSSETVALARSLGLTHFGENYVQEATRKMERVKSMLPNMEIHWHLIGSLQTNKSKFVVGKFDLIHSVDRIELARTLNTRAQEAGIIQNILVQVKIGDEPGKGGALPQAAPALIEAIQELPALRIRGLMMLPPLEAEPEDSRKYFAKLREYQVEWTKLLSPERGSLEHLSMGTTHDFEIAIEEGATLVRVGTALFGPRG